MKGTLQLDCWVLIRKKGRTNAALTNNVLIASAEAEAVSDETGGRGNPAKEGMSGVATAWENDSRVMG